ncbi:MAG: bacillithiol biosynthesis cysteine-adding enzyme BshC [Bacteroidota bacterium]|nr:bacillithiol biosynthesis cysteine-adding enzyme BshC [Bacteroidota bacterium]
MDCTAQRIPYRQTGYFSNIVLDYIDQSPQLKPFFEHPPGLQGIQKAIDARKLFPTNCEVLVQELKKQYSLVEANEKAIKNIESLSRQNTFTVTTAHQPNIFTGPVYFIYKIIHTIKLADHLDSLLPENKFVPVFYMGSEDADLDELGQINLDGEQLAWNTKQTGAVGRMKVDEELTALIEVIEGQLTVLPFGAGIISLIKDYYKIGEDIQSATFKLINELFCEYGLVILLPDNAAFKQQMIPVFEDDLLNQRASGIVENTSKQLEELYKVQAQPREINLFYLKDSIRGRIIKTSNYKVQGTSIEFSEDELKKELKDHSECFSPNVILRGLYQATILPDIIFIGGGGELAYWLQFKDLFTYYKVPYPVLVLRNSFLIVENKWQEKINKLQFTIEDFFKPEQGLVNMLVARESKQQLSLNGTFSQTEQLYDLIKQQATAVDPSLEKHVDALKTNALQRLRELEKKMLSAEKRKFADQQRQIQTIQNKLFPENDLQERYVNMMFYYGKWGRDFIQKLYEHSLNLEQEFVILSEP